MAILKHPCEGGNPDRPHTTLGLRFLGLFGSLWQGKLCHLNGAKGFLAQQILGQDCSLGYFWVQGSGVWRDVNGKHKMQTPK